ncbi:Y-family DNA polymerase [Corynebacterium pacaense]|uniref:Y-family DNA polymerase n=1 Tax=Corynebacterium pacaense TaxID=1816684 RepID=UPI0009BC2328|nr:DNA polymerase Y family protein [Corynebacterium pacaense]
MALWFPDWPVQAVLCERSEALSPQSPVAVSAGHRIRVCGHAARARGVRRGMRVRQARAVCPELTVVDDDPDRDGREFEPVVAALGDVASSVEVLRPGLVAVEVGAVARYNGSEDRAAQLLIDAASRRGTDVVIGVADEISTAIVAAVVGRGASIGFLQRQPLRVLAAEEALGCDPEVVGALGDLGVSTLGELAALPVTSVATRFGAAGLRCHTIATARQARNVAPPITRAGWEVSHEPEEPITRVDTAAFVARTLAMRLHRVLAGAGVVCQVLRVTAGFTDGTDVSRLWRTSEALTEAATADRVRWQLDGWLTVRGEVDGDGTEGIIFLELAPLECVPPEMASGGLWDTGGASRALARQVIARVQSTLGVDAVLQPVPVGGRGVEDRIQLVPYGERRDPVRDPGGPWVGRIPGPLPARLGGGPNHPASRVALIGASGERVQVTAEAVLSAQPYALAWGKKHFLVTGWAGPWPVDDRWWSAEGNRYARLQVVGHEVDDDAAVAAWLLIWAAGRWRVEATY